MRTCVCPYGRKAKYVLLLFKHAEEQVHAAGDVLTSASLVRTIKGSANAWSSAACMLHKPAKTAQQCWAASNVGQFWQACAARCRAPCRHFVMRPHALSIAIACLHTIQIGT